MQIYGDFFSENGFGGEGSQERGRDDPALDFHGNKYELVLLISISPIP